MDKLIWVKIETTRGTDEIYSFKGQLLEAVFNSIVSNQVASDYIQLNKTYWISTSYDDDGNKVGEKLFEYGVTEHLKAYRGDIFLRIEHVVSIAPIDAEVDTAAFKKQRDHLSVVSPIKH